MRNFRKTEAVGKTRALSKGASMAAGIASVMMFMPATHSQSRPASPVDVTAAALRAQPPSASWLSYNGDYSGRRYSTLSQITSENVTELRAQWVFHSDNSDRLEVTPVVVDSLMLVTSANDAYALEAKTGRIIWHHQMPKSEGLIDDA